MKPIGHGSTDLSRLGADLGRDVLVVQVANRPVGVDVTRVSAPGYEVGEG